MNSTHFPQCPRCTSPLRRTRRLSTDWVINVVLPVYRYRCSNCFCTWEGLKRQPRRGSSSQPQTAIANSSVKLPSKTRLTKKSA